MPILKKPWNRLLPHPAHLKFSKYLLKIDYFSFYNINIYLTFMGRYPNTYYMQPKNISEYAINKGQCFILLPSEINLYIYMYSYIFLLCFFFSLNKKIHP